MKKKVLGFCLVFLFFGTTFAFSQSNRVDTQRLRCTFAQKGDGTIFNNISYVNLNLYDDGEFQFAFYYRDGTPTDYLYLRNGRQSGNTVFYQASLSTTAGNRIFNLTADVKSFNDGTIMVNVQQNGRQLFVVNLD
jgi:hypothetical protein